MHPKKIWNEILDLFLSPKDYQNDGAILGDNTLSNQKDSN